MNSGAKNICKENGQISKTLEFEESTNSRYRRIFREKIQISDASDFGKREMGKNEIPRETRNPKSGKIT